jgi:DNA-binding SARP family transcriptional activator
MAEIGYLAFMREGAPVRVRLLGPVDVLVGDELTPVRDQRRTAVLAALSVHAGAVVSTDRLIDAVWGDEPPKGALQSLRSHMSYLRRLLGIKSAIVARVWLRSRTRP